MTAAIAGFVRAGRRGLDHDGVAAPRPLEEADPGRDTSGKRRTRVSVVARWTGWALVVLALLVCRPTSLGGDHGVTIVSGQSMEPGLSHGDLVVTRKRDAYDIGDVVVYSVPSGPAMGRHIVHRLVDVDADGWLTRGDNRETLDSFRPTDADIIGIVVADVPAGGRWLRFTGSIWVLAASAALFVGVWVHRWDAGRGVEDDDPPTGDGGRIVS